jgi:hypothetical protein
MMTAHHLDVPVFGGFEAVAPDRFRCLLTHMKKENRTSESANDPITTHITFKDNGRTLPQVAKCFPSR